MPKILIASLIGQKAPILREFFRSLEQLRTDGLTVEYMFIDGQEEESHLVKLFAQRRKPVYTFPGSRNDDCRYNEQDPGRVESPFGRMAGYKDKLLQFAGTNRFDYIFLVDSDLVLQPGTLMHLLGRKKDIIAEVVWTRWAPEMAPLPQVWDGGQYRLFRQEAGETVNAAEQLVRQQEFLAMLRRPGLYPVGGLGACVLISRKAIAAGVSFRRIPNLDLAGEDRHFCIRATVLGFDLFADTCMPPLHLCRESDLVELPAFHAQHFPLATSGPKLLLAMLVRNEAERYLKQVLRQARLFVDAAVILNDTGTDNTEQVCREALAGLPLSWQANTDPHFDNEVALRKQLWDVAVGCRPEWIVILDADEMFEDAMISQISRLTGNTAVDAYYFRLYDMWDKEHFREDDVWSAHRVYRPFMVRCQPDKEWRWPESPLHCGRFPENISELRGARSEIRIQHFGWMNPLDRLNKYYQYRHLDREGTYGFKERYLSILDPKPRLLPWRKEAGRFV